MSKVLITRSKLDRLAAAVSAKSGVSLPMTIAQMQTAVENISTGGADFIVELTYNASTDMWSPTCTFAEIQAAYNAGKTIVTLAQGEVQNINRIWESSGTYEDDNQLFYYNVLYPAQYAEGVDGQRWHYYYFNSSSVYDDGYDDFVNTASLDTKTITTNGTYDPLDENPPLCGYSQVTVNVSGGSGGGGGVASRKQINFIDYDGTILHSYTASEWASVTALPSNPSHTGLTAQGWNWTKAQIDAQLTAIPNGDIWVGQMYITDDGKTRVYIHLEEGRLHPYLGICPYGTVVVDWGDNSATDTLTGTSSTTVKIIDHVYASSGDYMITFTVSDGWFAFYGTSNTTYLLRKDNITTANTNRVYSNAVRKVEIGASVSIGNYAFCYCSSLENITIPSSTATIGTNAFQYCYSLKSATIPSSTKYIESYLFYSCHGLSNVAIQGGVTTIRSYAFRYCYSIKSITIPSTVTNLGNYAFSNCTSLSEVIVPNAVTSIGAYLFQSCSSLSEVTLQSGITSIATYMFSGCSSITSIIIPSSVTSISTYAFQNCSSLESITIPMSITSIGTYTFNGCYALAIITIPSGVTSIAANAFLSCYGLAEIHFEPTTPPTCANANAWSNIPTDCIIYVPTGTLEAYTTAANYPSSETYTYIEE